MYFIKFQGKIENVRGNGTPRSFQFPNVSGYILCMYPIYPMHHIKSYFECPGSDGFVRLGDNVLKNNKNKLELKTPNSI